MMGAYVSTPIEPETAPAVKPKPLRAKIDPTLWATVEREVATGMLITEASKKFGIDERTIRQRAHRNKWVTPRLVRAQVTAELRRSAGKVTAKIAEDWLAKGEKLRVVTFEKADQSIRKFQPKAPKNFRELESAVKIARQAAGLETADVNVATLIQLNERMDNHEDEQPIEATDAEFEQEDAPVEAAADPAMLSEPSA